MCIRDRRRSETPQPIDTKFETGDYVCETTPCAKFRAKIIKIFVPIGGGVYGDGQSNAANRIFPRPTPVVIATKFGTKLAITRLA